MLRSLLFLTLLPYQSFAQRNCPTDTTKEFITESVFKDTVVSSPAGTYQVKVIRPGQGIIFKITIGWDCPEVFDEESSLRLKWQIPDSVTQFNWTYRFADSARQNFMYDYVAGTYMPNRVTGIALNGTISGNKQGNTWIITGNLQVMTRGRNTGTSVNNVSFSGVFTEWDHGIKFTRKKKKIPKEFF